MPTVPCFHVDAFSARPFGGNPAAVCLLTGSKSASWMQAVAAEMNLSETAFVRPTKRGFALRWFTPRCEVDLCGHATLATAHVLWQEGIAPPAQVLRFQARGGVLTASRIGSDVELDFPARAPEPCRAPAGLAAALGVAPKSVAQNQDDLLVEVASAARVVAVRPDLARLGKLPVRGVIVTARSSDPRWDFVSRFFAPRVGVDEDPVTGSAHCALAPYWSAKLGRDELRGYQASARGGVVDVRLLGDRVVLRGRAVTVVRGELLH